MPIEFVKQRIGSADLAIAVRQQEQLSYFTESSIQEDVTQTYLDAWVNSKFGTNDTFLNYVKSVLRVDNFMVFFKYLRNPLVSAELVNDRIKKDLGRVFFSDDAYFKYSIRKEDFTSIDELQSAKFNETLFNAMLFRHNDIVVTLMERVNTPRRELISIGSVVALDSSDGTIHKIAYSAVFEGQKGFMYMDKFVYAFYDTRHELVSEVPHDLGATPADYVSNEAFSSDSDIVRKSIFSFSRGDFEEYVFLKTLLKMTEPNGVIPVSVILNTKKKGGDGKDKKGQGEGEPMSAESLGGQQASVVSGITSSTSLIQPGASIGVDPRLKDDGSIDTAAVQNFVNFIHMPVEPFNYVNGRIKEIKSELLISLVGDFSEANTTAINELQVSKGYKSKEDKLRYVSKTLTVIRKASDFKYLALQHGKDNVVVDLFFGSDFFMETEKELNELFKSSPNPIERRDVLIKKSMNKHKFNPEKQKETMILYHLMPYCSDDDFDKAVAQKAVSNEVFSYYSRFNYWMNAFTAKYGGIVEFWEGMEGMDNSARIMVINSLIMDIISDANKVVIEDDNSAAKNAQAELRGSVGGITGIVNMLTNVSEPQTVELLVALYGLDRATAEAISKKPEKEIIEPIN